MENDAIDIDDLEWNTETNQWEKRPAATSSMPFDSFLNNLTNH